jgi:hypothetical protein
MKRGKVYPFEAIAGNIYSRHHPRGGSTPPKPQRPISSQKLKFKHITFTQHVFYDIFKFFMIACSVKVHTLETYLY